MDALRAKRKINLERIGKVVANERRKPELRRNFERLTAVVGAVIEEVPVEVV